MASLPEDSLVVDPATLALIAPADAPYAVVDVQLDKVNLGLDDIEEIIVGSFTLISHGGLYNVRVPWSREWDVEVGAEMARFSSELARVYDYPVEV